MKRIIVNLLPICNLIRILKFERIKILDNLFSRLNVRINNSQFIANSFIFCCALLLSFFSFSSSVEANNCYKKDLPSNLKKLLIEKVAIPVSSSDIAEVGKFSNMKIFLNAKTEGEIETGSNLNLTDFKDANGYAYVEFRVGESFNKIPVIKSYLDKKFPDSKGLIKVTNVNTDLIFYDTSGKQIETLRFGLSEGNNRVPICEFGKFNNVKNIVVKVKSFTGSFSINPTVD